MWYFGLTDVSVVFCNMQMWLNIEPSLLSLATFFPMSAIGYLCEHTQKHRVLRNMKGIKYSCGT